MPARPQWNMRFAASASTSAPTSASHSTTTSTSNSTSTSTPTATSSASSPKSSFRSDSIDTVDEGRQASVSSSTTPLPASSPAQPHNLAWLESSMVNQVSSLDVDLQVCDSVQHDAPSLFGLRRKIAAALPQLGFDDDFGGGGGGIAARRKRSRSRPAGGDSINNIAIDLANAEDTMGTEAPFHIVTPSTRDGSSTSGLSPFASSHSNAKHMAKLERELQEREKDYEVQLLSRFEISELNMDVYTEQRTGEWVQRGAAPPHAEPADTLPRIFSPWDIGVDTKAIIRRNKLRSFVELVDSTTAVRCPDCDTYTDREAGFRFHCEPCETCASTGLVKMVYVVCVTLRHSKFLPLFLPLAHLGGWFQDSIRTYLCTPEQHIHPALLQHKAMEAIRSSAYRVGIAHARQHDARLLCVKATLHKRSCNSVVVLHRPHGTLRTFDVTDSGQLKVGSNTEDAIRIRQTPGLTRLLAPYPLVARIDGLHQLVGIDRLVETTRRTVWKQYTIPLDAPAAGATGSGMVAPSSPRTTISETSTLYPSQAVPRSAGGSSIMSSPSPRLGTLRLATRSAMDLTTPARDRSNFTVDSSSVSSLPQVPSPPFSAPFPSSSSSSSSGARSGGARSFFSLGRSTIKKKKSASFLSAGREATVQ
ncbi:uncharacterized protein PFL1_06173 [Pseudozyma flocculosa PF-1]|uniref:Uncharacterized protein n=2 Tax=Pseudozyma flocculosa TaxID=84751 RepID=A0A5C3F8Z6_9BASI|nr:uncharacterized protein PFL1_06173 [Pseudozyma flocculosa PF-1]EPQ26238.1 hypothetical protein PFL1_06173 [Pseudozyma flocculosa PF-1]SPO40197.1 uncharacterized protein PSFLO_05679 [Pseudozyma flocculosa]